MDYTIELLKSELKTLTEKNKSLVHTGKILIETHALYRFDLFCGAIINRTLNLNRGFILQMKDKNFISAAPLVRISLDSLLRLFAAFQVDYNIDDFAQKIMRGESINKLKDKTGTLMQDHHLVKQLSKEFGFSWVKSVYDAGNEHVHFTSQHVFASVSLDDDPNSITIHGVMANDDSFMEMKEKVWAVKAMTQISTGIQDYLEVWINYKKSLDKKS